MPGKGVSTTIYQLQISVGELSLTGPAVLSSRTHIDDLIVGSESKAVEGVLMEIVLGLCFHSILIILGYFSVIVTLHITTVHTIYVS